MYNELTIIEKGSTIANNATSIVTQISNYNDTKRVRRAGRKLVYAIDTFGTARQLVNALNFDDEDLPRLNSLFNAFTYKATEDIMRG